MYTAPSHRTPEHGPSHRHRTNPEKQQRLRELPDHSAKDGKLMGDGGCRVPPAPEGSRQRTSASATLAASSPQRTRGETALPEAGSSSERNTSGAALQLEPSSWHRRSAWDQIEGAVVRWCQGRDVSISSLRFQVETHLEPLHGPSLPPPPLIHTFEDALIGHLEAAN
ncbi:hypothetical protein C343_02673 [Cryptococcus neoformans C23]|uniref:Uncharacterized protein n=2 Tax=Cryptococcus neoformans TaxID=5207 RepID=A0A854QJA1_CRYNE|nr:hypothetical protein CNAG_07832 [Cryptococcus neoformans var. grubii H99]AUB24270.1 hypothetical protein CKF44_07832 [Cryptococcus neoformans var. grubii]OWZ32943.1 hypothetical protein C347_02741 [Cryptococcus neoformans var. grubii AD2-60a]OWZ45054.1 hypothetical protein C343_02673 [Cryptococcus neoformans var. grubii C23]OWZ45926.1 hypothetical protein C353_02576 [Cryptococcus neoformans var. grubii AD1-83a]OWZ54939.1 hypothetical protein C368_03169 [Cryptococcus neoformans var. grubii 1|eukprot:XP_012048886.1 hypothetical protein CNAG_07832 [Cryptococcus neoformans var. grubii H99]